MAVQALPQETISAALAGQGRLLGPKLTAVLTVGPEDGKVPIAGPVGPEARAVFRVGCLCGWRNYRLFRGSEEGWVGSGRPCPRCRMAVDRLYRKGAWPGRHRSSEVVYLLHYLAAIGGDKPQDRAQHYLGSARAEYLAARLADQRDGCGANLPRVMAERGIPFVCVRTWPGDRQLERRIKRGGHGPRQCPLCNPNAHRRYVVPGGWIFGRDDGVPGPELGAFSLDPRSVLASPEVSSL
jgi:hypothetical protein